MSGREVVLDVGVGYGEFEREGEGGYEVDGEDEEWGGYKRRGDEVDVWGDLLGDAW